jgi:hypothetical protein
MSTQSQPVKIKHSKDESDLILVEWSGPPITARELTELVERAAKQMRKGLK